MAMAAKKSSLPLAITTVVGLQWSKWMSAAGGSPPDLYPNTCLTTSSSFPHSLHCCRPYWSRVDILYSTYSTSTRKIAIALLGTWVRSDIWLLSCKKILCLSVRFCSDLWVISLSGLSRADFEQLLRCCCIQNVGLAGSIVAPYHEKSSLWSQQILNTYSSMNNHPHPFDSVSSFCFGSF